MGTSRNTPALPSQSIHLAGPETARLHFSGPPTAVEGYIPLINEGTEKQKIRTIAVSSEKLRDVAKLPLREIHFFARLQGGDQANVPASFSLDPQTPPGTYDLEVTVGRRSLRAAAHVSEVVDLRIEPAEITIVAGSGTAYSKTVMIENAGNVPLPLGAQSDAPIFEPDDLVTALLNGLSKGDRKSAESMAKAFLNEWAELKAGTLVAKRSALVIAPGQKLAMDIEFEIPSDLKALRHYRCDLPFYNAALTVEIYVKAKAGSSSKSTKKQEASAHAHD